MRLKRINARASVTKTLILFGVLGANFLAHLPATAQNYPGRTDRTNNVYIPPVYTPNPSLSNYSPYTMPYPYGQRVYTPNTGVSVDPVFPNVQRVYTPNGGIGSYPASPNPTPDFQRVYTPRGNVTNYIVPPSTIPSN